MKYIKVFLVNIILFIAVLFFANMTYKWLQPRLPYGPIVSPYQGHLGDFLPNQREEFNNNSPALFLATINKEGYRDSTDVVKCDSTIGILGDSIVFGWGVEDSQTITSSMNRFLKDHNKCADVLNLGVPFYTISDEMEFIQDKIGTLKSNNIDRIVLVYFSGNDLDSLNAYGIFRERHIGGLLERRNILRRLLETRLGYYVYQTKIVSNTDINTFFLRYNLSYIRNEHCSDNAKKFSGCPDKQTKIDSSDLDKNPILNEYKPLLARYGMAYKTLSKTLESNNIKLYFYIVPSVHSIDTVEKHREALESVGVKVDGVLNGAEDSASYYIKSDGHLSSIGNERVAKQLIDILKLQ